MKTILRNLSELEDPGKLRKSNINLRDIVSIVPFATLGNGNDWHKMAAFSHLHEDFLKKYFKLENRIPSHDTIQRVMGI